VKHFSLSDIQAWDRFYRANFVNSLSGFKPVSLIASKSSKEDLNLAIFSNIVHIGADPAMIGFINRPREAAPHTIRNIEETGIYTINHIRGEFAEQAHQTSAKYPDGVNEFDAVGLNPEFKVDFGVPFVKESHIQYAMELFEIIPLRMNNTFLVVGQLQHAFVEKGALKEDGFLELSAAGSMVSLGLDAYYQTTPHSRFSYAKPDQSPRSISNV
jgi:flavin reductase (DIM6/NTAB) family NADH-FMN oxidoreductase RutF